MSLFRSLSLVSVALFPLNAWAEDAKPAPFEFHGYARLGAITDANPLNPANSEQGDGQFGLYESRHVRNLQYIRLQTLANLNDGMKVNVEAQLDGALPHQAGNWSGSAVNLRNAYLEIPANEGAAKLWFGARRMEFEDVRLFDATSLLGDTTLFGAGVDSSFAGIGSTTALGMKDGQFTKKNTDNTETNFPTKDTTLFQRFDVKLSDNMALRPTAIINHSSGVKTEAGTLDKASDNVKVGTVLSSWGDAGWNNSFVWMSTSNAAGSDKKSDKDYTLGVATSGDFEGLKDADVGIMYGAIVESTSFKKDQKKYKVKDGAMTEDGTGKSRLTAALGVQPVYYITSRLHGALDLSYTMTNKVGRKEDVNMILVTPIVRYAANRNAMGTPQIFTSFTYGKYDSKVKKDAKGKATDTLLTTQTGMEVWF